MSGVALCCIAKSKPEQGCSIIQYLVSNNETHFSSPVFVLVSCDQSQHGVDKLVKTRLKEMVYHFSAREKCWNLAGGDHVTPMYRSGRSDRGAHGPFPQLALNKDKT
ncbi:hypothetical protein TRP8649_03203 [Pelagimonas phthalicica]|uniref:Uncharacterized protein n=1 Tax=Pelagimonas phthalicica TaxID=1037362 RepID=A0A238JGJ4_9RHOB|nr:hypothetical protein CLV87_3204 [Pelagimonas phthalicica]SMX29072.1 hypothetical protein TRP8649_03203 [Pelagimonas phthalicica]